MQYTLGKDCHAYVSATALTAVADATSIPTAELTLIKDLKINEKEATAETTTRASGGVQTEQATLTQLSITFQMPWKPSDAQFAILLTAKKTKAEVAFAALDGLKATTGSQGPSGNWVVTDFTRTEDINGIVMTDVELKPSSFYGWVTTT